jgi:cytochrome c
MYRKLLIVSLLLLNTAFSQTKVRPKEAWVFRSVLDKKARIITVALNKDLYVAYDGNTGGVFKIWKDGVNYEGTIWNTKHGPQPTSRGKAYMECGEEPVWVLLKDGKEVKSKIQFRGYRWKNNSVTFLIEVITADNQVITIEETPEYVVKPGENILGLERKFKIGDLPAGYSIISIIEYKNLISNDDYKTDGNYKLVAKNEQYLELGKTYDIKGKLVLKPNAITTFTAYFNPKVLQ